MPSPPSYAGLWAGCGRLCTAAQATEQKPARLPPRRPAPPMPAFRLQAGVFGAKADTLFLMSDYQR